MKLRIGVALTTFAITAASLSAQFTLQDSGTTADLRGIVSVGDGNAWASGTHGTVLRTEDGGFVWQGCAVPPGAQDLDFRGIQAFDDQTAIVMSSGKGALSRVYKTTDGCKSWKLVFTDPDSDGFFDAMLYLPDYDLLLVLGDPVQGRFRLFAQYGNEEDAAGPFVAYAGGDKCLPSTQKQDCALAAIPGEAVFAASNSSLIQGVGKGPISFVTGGARSEIVREEHVSDADRGASEDWSHGPLPFAAGESSGAFSIAAAPYSAASTSMPVVVVGGDYRKANESAHTAAYSSDRGYHWSAAATMPHGYRSSVAYDAASKTWITVGPNGTDISTDDGKNWRALKPGVGDDPNADKQWNALSLPFVVGPHGRIGRLRDNALPRLR